MPGTEPSSSQNCCANILVHGLVYELLQARVTVPDISQT